MGARRIRREQRDVDQAESRRVNGPRKAAERARRAEAIKGLIKKSKLPFTPPIMSWLSGQLDKPSRLITQAEVDKVVAG